MAILNATSKTIRIIAKESVKPNEGGRLLANISEVEFLMELPPSGIMAKKGMTLMPKGAVGSIPLDVAMQVAIEGLPPEQEDLFYIVPEEVAQIAAEEGRRDCLALGWPVLDVSDPTVIFGHTSVFRF